VSVQRLQQQTQRTFQDDPPARAATATHTAHAMKLAAGRAQYDAAQGGDGGGGGGEDGLFESAVKLRAAWRAWGLIPMLSTSKLRALEHEVRSQS